MIRDYCIMTVDETRAENKARIRATLSDWSEHFPRWVDGRDAGALARFFAETPEFRVHSWKRPTVGAIGYWGSLLSAFRYVAETRTPMLILEDDAETEEFTVMLLDAYLRMASLSIDVFQAFTLMDKANPNDRYGQVAAPVGDSVWVSWHQWPLGAIVLFPSGADKLLQWVRANPVTETGDMTIANLGRSGRLVVECPAPGRESPFKMNHGAIPSTIAETPLVPEGILPRSAV